MAEPGQAAAPAFDPSAVYQAAGAPPPPAFDPSADYQPASKPATPPPDRFAQDREITEAWAQNHPILGPIARFLVSGGQNAANAITGAPGQLYHAIMDPPKPEEAALSPEQRFVYRLGGKEAIDAAQSYGRGDVTRNGALSVLPEALAAGVGQAAGGAIYGKLLDLAPDLADAAKAAPDTATAQAAKVILGRAKTVADVATFERLGKIWNALKTLPADVRAAYKPPVYPGAPLPENPGVFPGAPEPSATPEQLNPSLISESRTLPGQISPESIRPPAQPIPARSGLMLSGEVEKPAVQPASAEGAENATEPTPSGEGIPRTLSGDSALRQVLTGQDNQALLKIARSRGINVTKEAQLKPGVADKLLVNKIIDDFSDDELNEVGAQYLENSRFKHAFGEIGPEAWKTLSLQTYFPDLELPLSRMLRTQKAIATANAPKFAPTQDVGAMIKRSIVTDPETGRPEFSDVVAAKKAAKTVPPEDDTGSAMQEMLKRAKKGQKLSDMKTATAQ